MCVKFLLWVLRNHTVALRYLLQQQGVNGKQFLKVDQYQSVFNCAQLKEKLIEVGIQKKKK